MDKNPNDHYESFDSEYPVPEPQDVDDNKLLLASFGIMKPIVRQTLSVTERGGCSLPPGFDQKADH